MKKKIILAIFLAVLMILSGSIFYALQAGLLTNIFKKEEVKTEHQNMKNMEELQSINPSELPTINIPYDKQQMIGVQTAKTSVKPLVKIIRTVGRVNYDETKLVTVNTKFEGYIEKLYINSMGQYVKKGEPLAEIYSPELLSTQLEFLNLLKWRNNGSKEAYSDDNIGKMLSKDAQEIMEAAKERLRLFGINDEQINEVEKSGKPKRTLTIYSPVSGYIIQKQALQGTRVIPGQALFDIADLSTVWVLADIYEQDLSLIKTGQTATLTFNYFPGKTFISTVDYIYPTLENATRTAKARFIIPNRNGQLKPQMYTNTEITVNLGNKLIIPESAVINTGMRKIVYVDLGNGNFQQRNVVTGFRNDGMVEILKGLKPGEIVSTSANFLIDSEARLRGSAQ